MDTPIRKYGFFTAVSMVVGIVIGSGVFKSAGDVLAKAGGSLPIAILAWLIGGLIVVISTYAFSIVALKSTKNSGIIDYVEEIAGQKTGYIVGWFLTFVYFPAVVGILAWLAGSVTNTLLNTSTDLTWYLGIFYLLLSYSLNLASPKLAGKWQVSATVLKVIPLLLIAFVGLIVGLINGTTIESLGQAATNITTTQKVGLASAVAVTAFAYDGWITALSITHELENPKKNLAKALIFGSTIIVVIYVIFFIGLSGVITNNEAINLAGSLDTSVLAASRLFGNFFGSVVSVLILVSVLGTLNGLTLGSIRGMYQISVKNIGPRPDFFTRLAKGDAPIYSGLVSFIMAIFWGIIWFGNFQGYWGGFMDTSVLSIVFLYSSFIIVYFDIIKNFTELNPFKRFVIPVLASFGALYLIYGAFASDPVMFFNFSVIVIIILIIGLATYGKKGKV